MKKRFLLLYVLAIIIFPWRVNAAGVLLQLNRPNLEIGRQYELKVAFDPQTDSVNGLEGSITLPAALLSDIKIKDGGSAVPLWVQSPTVNIDSGGATVSFSAISPAGINGYLFSILFEGANIGQGEFQFQGSMLLADGQGTKKNLQTETIPVNFIPKTAATTTPGQTADFSADQTKPENFQVFVSRAPSILNDQWFSVFNAQDKDSGIAFYQVLETADQTNPELQPGWTTSASPYVLKDQNLPKYLFVKAVDKEGNYRISSWQNPHPAASPLTGQNGKVYVIIIIIIVILLSGILEIYINRKHKKTNPQT